MGHILVDVYIKQFPYIDSRINISIVRARSLGTFLCSCLLVMSEHFPQKLSAAQLPKLELNKKNNKKKKITRNVRKTIPLTILSK